MNTSIFTFPTDFAGEGTGEVIERLKDAGMDGVLLAANYHAARDVFPHNPRYRVRALTTGPIFMPGASLRNTRIGARCTQDPVATGEYTLAALAARLIDAGLRPEAWCNYCHLDNWSLPEEVLCRNVFGDLDYASVCPANPEVLDFAEALTRDVASTGTREILGEALHFAPLVHGYHHERWITQLSEVAQFLLSLCFCPSCQAGMRVTGVHVASLESAVRGYIDAELSNQGEGPARDSTDSWLTAEALAAVVGDELLGLLAHRVNAVNVLHGRVTAAAQESGAVLRYVDPSGAIKGYVSGASAKTAGPVPSWVVGFDPGALGGVAELGILAYAANIERVRADVAAYADLLSDMSQLSVILRPSKPDCVDEDDLSERVALCREAGVGKVSFYHYSFMPLNALKWIRSALGPTF